MEKYFLHRIQKDGGSFTKGIEVHDTFDSAMLSCHGRMKLGYGASPSITFVSCKITDMTGDLLYEETYNGEEEGNTFFMHHIRLAGETFTKDIDVCADFNAAKASRHAQMEYGYNNPRFTEVEMVSCMITDMDGTVIMPETWNKPEPEPEAEE